MIEPEPGLPQPGTVIAGKYRIERKIGQGGMGVVYLARHEVLEEPVAVKVVRREFATRGDVGVRARRSGYPGDAGHHQPTPEEGADSPDGPCRHGPEPTRLPGATTVFSRVTPATGTLRPDRHPP